MNQAGNLYPDVIEKEAEEHAFTYLDVRASFEGHAVCDKKAWIHGYTGSVDSFHPTADGQRSGY